MRGPDGRLIADLNDDLPAFMSGSMLSASTSSLNENLTEYVLLPELINDPPYISQSIYRSSSPNIKPIQFNEPNLQTLFVDEQGIVKVLVGTTFRLRLKASQPPIYNVENGRPTLIVDQPPLPPSPAPGVPVTTGSLESSLVYTWQRDGEDFISQIDEERRSSNVRVNGNRRYELLFNNISPKFAGTYTCEISNDIGTVESEQITIEVYNPDIDDYFYNNLVKNPYGKDGLNEWLTPDTEFITGRFSNTEFKNLSQPWNRDSFGYTVDMLYPRPYHINTYHVKNSNLVDDLIQDGYYFTREKYKYISKDGRSVVNAEYDIDLQEIKDYIQGGVYGVSGVRAIFGAYVGNAVSRYRSTILTALYEFRSYRGVLDITQPRPSLVNCLLGGVPLIEEEATIFVTEYDNETPLLSTILTTNGNTVTNVAGYVIHDPWYKRMNDPAFDPPGPLLSTPNYTTVGGTREEKILWIIENFLDYPNNKYVPTYGQYAEWNKAIIDKLNFRTNKIRISVNFTAFHDILTLTDARFLDESDEPFEILPWDLMAQTGKFPQRYPDDYFKTTVGTTPDVLLSIDSLNNNTYGSNTPLKKYTPLLGSARSIVTGLNLVLIPIETTQPAKVSYYTKTILEPNVNPTVYSSVDTNTGPLAPLLLPGYQTHYVGVHLANVWRIPHRVYDTELGNRLYSDNLNQAYDAGPEIASLTAISTFKYLPQPLATGGGGSQTNVDNLLDDSRRSWQFAPLDDMIDAISQGNIEVVYFSGSKTDITKGSLPDLKGVLRSGILSFVSDGLIKSAPTAYKKVAITNVDDFKRNLGFEFDFEVHKHGYRTAATDSGSLFLAWKEPDPTWTVPKVTHKHNLLQNIAYDYVLGGSTPTPPPPPTGIPPTPTQSLDQYNQYFNISWDNGGYAFGGQNAAYQNAVDNSDSGKKIAYSVDNFKITPTYPGEDVTNKTSAWTSFKLKALPNVDVLVDTDTSNVPEFGYGSGVGEVVVGLEGWVQATGGGGASLGLDVSEFYVWRILGFNLSDPYNQPDIQSATAFQPSTYGTPNSSPMQAMVCYPGSDDGFINLIVDVSEQLDMANMSYGYADPVTGLYQGHVYDINTRFGVSATDTTVTFYINDTAVHTTPRQDATADLRFSARNVCNKFWTQNNGGGLTQIYFGPYNPASGSLSQQPRYSVIWNNQAAFSWLKGYNNYSIMNNTRILGGSL